MEEQIYVRSFWNSCWISFWRANIFLSWEVIFRLCSWSWTENAAKGSTEAQEEDPQTTCGIIGGGWAIGARSPTCILFRSVLLMSMEGAMAWGVKWWASQKASADLGSTSAQKAWNQQWAWDIDSNAFQKAIDQKRCRSSGVTIFSWFC